MVCTTFLAKDEACQKQGLVGVVWNTGPNRVNDVYSAWKVGSVCNFLPIRFVGFHYCYDNPLMASVIAMCMYVTGQETIVRFRAHQGTSLGDPSLGKGRVALGMLFSVPDLKYLYG